MSMFFNPGVESAQRRAQLAMSAAPAASAAAPSAAAAPVNASPGAGADQAAAGAEGVGAAPPNPKKIILASVIRGAVSGASMMFGINSFGPKVPFINNFMTKVITKIPLLSKLGWPMGTLGALGVGAAMGAIFGLIGGVRKARSEAASYVSGQQRAMEAQGQQQQSGAVGDPLVLGPDGKPISVDPATNRPVQKPSAAHAKKNPMMSAQYKGVRGTRHARDIDGSSYHIQRGDTLWALSRRYNVTIDDIVRANTDKIHNPNLIYAGDTIVIPDAAAARAARRRRARRARHAS